MRRSNLHGRQRGVSASRNITIVIYTRESDVSPNLPLEMLDLTEGDSAWIRRNVRKIAALFRITIFKSYQFHYPQLILPVTETMSVRARSLVSARASNTAIKLRPSPRASLKPIILRSSYTDWRGTREEDHGLNRVQKGDTADPQTDAMKGGQEEREKAAQNRGNDNAKSQATKEKDQSRSKEKIEKEFPEAPRPIIGMNDERGRVGVSGVPSTSLAVRLTSIN